MYVIYSQTKKKYCKFNKVPNWWSINYVTKKEDATLIPSKNLAKKTVKNIHSMCGCIVLGFKDE